ncbi:unnamed protein product, partial [Ectocarpus sp. 4 AP-2014]
RNREEREQAANNPRTLPPISEAASTSWRCYSQSSSSRPRWQLGDQPFLSLFFLQTNGETLGHSRLHRDVETALAAEPSTTLLPHLFSSSCLRFGCVVIVASETGGARARTRGERAP